MYFYDIAAAGKISGFFRICAGLEMGRVESGCEDGFNFSSLLKRAFINGGSWG